ncbi:MAG: RagB/SusD family nutrient uptake outer membrane protein [Bacteroidota bacterium]
MRKLIYIKSILILTLTLVSCNEEEWLEEVPLDFKTTTNSYNTSADFEVAVNHLYAYWRDEIHMFNFRGGSGPMMYYPTDVAWCALPGSGRDNLLGDTYVPEYNNMFSWWQRLYIMVSDANVILSRINNEEVVFNDENQRKVLIAEASFFRAMAYRMLGTLYGGVPLALEELTEPKRDFTRATVDEVWAQCISDLEYAVENLPTVNERATDGRLSKAAARHLLTEIYISAKDYPKAISTATAVIDDANFELMTDRFGTRKDEVNGDVYWDLFRIGNQNRTGGNNEAIWVTQYEHLVEGGGADFLPRALVALTWQLKDTAGINLFDPVYDSNLGGRGIGWLAPTPFMDGYPLPGDPTPDNLWTRSGADDMRNSVNNIISDPIVTNTASTYFGLPAVSSGAVSANDGGNGAKRLWAPIFTKLYPQNNYPEIAVVDAETRELNSNANQTFRDRYVFRLAETYLLRAEAYVMSGDPTNAAADVNAVRARVTAAPVAAGEVDLDYILDERARELSWEEFRMITLMRTGKFVERVRAFNGKATASIMDRNSLWPIPAAEIERNSEAVLEQNPGY